MKPLPMQPKAHDVCPKCGGVDSVCYKRDNLLPELTVRYHLCACGKRFKTEDARAKRYLRSGLASPL